MHIIEIKNVSQQYLVNKPILKNVSFNVNQGTIHGLIGRNGAGKTTLIKTIIGAIINFTGQIKLNGVPIEKNKKNLISYMPEKNVFPENISALTYVAYMGFLCGGSYKQNKLKAINLFEEFDILHLARRSPNGFSTGEKKKIMIMQAIISSARILIFDEPSANLDPIANADLVKRIIKLKKEGYTILICSHDLLLFDRIVEEITIIDKGVIKYSGVKEKFCGKLNLYEAYIQNILKLGSNNE